MLLDAKTYRGSSGILVSIFSHFPKLAIIVDTLSRIESFLPLYITSPSETLPLFWVAAGAGVALFVACAGAVLFIVCAGAVLFAAGAGVAFAFVPELPEVLFELTDWIPTLEELEAVQNNKKSK